MGKSFFVRHYNMKYYNFDVILEFIFISFMITFLIASLYYSVANEALYGMVNSGLIAPKIGVVLMLNIALNIFVGLLVTDITIRRVKRYRGIE